MNRTVIHTMPINSPKIIGKNTIEERATNLAQYIIDSKDTVRGAAKKFAISKSTVHTEVTFQNGRNKSPIIPESIEIKKVFLAEVIK